MRRMYPARMPQKEPTVQKPVRVPESWVPRLKVLADKLGESGIQPSEAAVIRLALGRGLDALEAEHGIQRGAAADDSATPEKGRPEAARKPRK